MDNVIFPVDKIPAKELLPDYTTKSGISHAIVREDTGEILHWASKDYALITNKEIISKFGKYLNDNGYENTVHATGYDSVRFRIQFIMKSRQAAIQVGDMVAGSLTLDNSYNGTIRYRFGTGVTRLSCLNGLQTTEKMEGINMLHTPGADEGIAVEKSLELVSLFMAKFDDAIEPYYDLAEQSVRNLPNRVDELIEATAFPIGMRDDVILQVEKEMKTLNQEASDWLVYNGFNFMLGQIEHYLGRKGDSIDRQILNYLLSY